MIYCKKSLFSSCLHNFAIAQCHSLFRMLIIPVLILSGSVLVHGQEVIDTSSLLKGKEYGSLLKQVIDKSPAESPQLQQFETSASIAISLSKTNGWEADTGKLIEGLIEKYPNPRRYLSGLRNILDGNLTGLQQLFDGEQPSYSSWHTVGVLLREHGYPLACNAFSVIEMTGSIAFGQINAQLLKQGTEGWLWIPKEKREPLDKLMMARLADNPQRANEIAMTFFRMYINGRNVGQGVDSKESFELALLIGHDTGLVSLETARVLAEAGKKSDAVQVAEIIANNNQLDARIVSEVAKFLWWNIGDSSSAMRLYNNAMVSVQEPYARKIRLEYLTFLSWVKEANKIVPDAPTIENMQQQQKLLIAADALFVSGKAKDASTKYKKQFDDINSTIDERLAAWSGLLDTDPSTALDTGEILLTELAKADPERRSLLLRWFGLELWRAIDWVIPYKYSDGRPISGWETNVYRIDTVDGWEEKSAILVEHLLNIDTKAILQPDEGNYSTLRFASSVIFAVASKPELSINILQKPVQYLAIPPKDGWRDPLGRPTQDADKPRLRIAPTGDESERLTVDLLETLNRYRKSAKCIPPLSAVISDLLVNRIDESQDDAVIQSCMKQLASVIKQTSISFDQLPKPLRTDQPLPMHEIDITPFMAIEKAVRHALTNDAAAKSGATLARNGLLEAMLISNNPQLLDILFSLMTLTLDRYSAVINDPQKLALEADYLIRYLEGRKAYDMKQYSQQLQQKYIQK